MVRGIYGERRLHDNEATWQKNYMVRGCGGERAKTDNTPLTRSPYFLAGSMLGYSPLVN